MTFDPGETVTNVQSDQASELQGVRRRLEHLAHRRLFIELEPAEARSYDELCTRERALIDAGPAGR